MQLYENEYQGSRFKPHNGATSTNLKSFSTFRFAGGASQAPVFRWRARH
jgi:hypothetical protein